MLHCEHVETKKVLVVVGSTRSNTGRSHARNTYPQTTKPIRQTKNLKIKNVETSVRLIKLDIAVIKDTRSKHMYTTKHPK